MSNEELKVVFLNRLQLDLRDIVHWGGGPTIAGPVVVKLVMNLCKWFDSDIEISTSHSHSFYDLSVVVNQLREKMLKSDKEIN